MYLSDVTICFQKNQYNYSAQCVSTFSTQVIIFKEHGLWEHPFIVYLNKDISVDLVLIFLSWETLTFVGKKCISAIIQFIGKGKHVLKIMH